MKMETNEELNQLSVEELVNLAVQKVAEERDVFAKEQAILEDKDRNRQCEVVRQACRSLPKALHELTSFYRWHNPNFEYHELWDAEVLIQIEGAAGILMYLDVNGRTDDVQEIEVAPYRSNYLFAIMRWGISDGEVRIYNHEKGDDLLSAIARSVEIGDEKGQAERALAGRKIAEADEPVKAEKKLEYLEDMEQMIEGGLERLDRGHADQALVLNLAVIAKALVVMLEKNEGLAVTNVLTYQQEE